jgi:hypothetical protein
VVKQGTKEENPEKKTCFVVGPIGAEYGDTRRHADWLLNGIIIPIFEAHFADYDVIRADTINAPGMIDAQVIKLLLDAELVIADMSEKNANAFYEMGIRHMAQKPIIHMFDKKGSIPFDVAPHRAIPFSIDLHSDVEAAKSALKLAIEETQKEGFEVDNPVTRARGIVKLEERATPEMTLLLDELAAIKETQIAMQSYLGLKSDPDRTYARFTHGVGTLGLLAQSTLRSSLLRLPGVSAVEVTENIVRVLAKVPAPQGLRDDILARISKHAKLLSETVENVSL